MFQHFLRSKAPIRAVAVVAALGSGIVLPPAAQAVRPGGNGRIAYLKAGPVNTDYDVVVFFDGRFNKRITDSHDFLDRVTWCDRDTLVTPSSNGVRHGPSWREDKILYWKENAANPPSSQGIFSVKLGDLNEFGPYGGTASERCTDPAALPDGDGFLCVGADTFIKE